MAIIFLKMFFLGGMVMPEMHAYTITFFLTFESVVLFRSKRAQCKSVKNT